MPELLPGSSYLVTDPAALDSLLPSTNQGDRTVVSASELTVSELRGLIRRLNETALGDSRVFVLLDADQLSAVIQNTLLKIVEEPPGYLIVVVQAKHPGKLLPTLLSRLHPVNQLNPLQAPLKEAPNIEEISKLDKSKAIEALRQLANWQLLHPTAPEQIKLTHDTIERLELRCNLKLTIDRFLLRTKLLSGME